MKVAPLTRSCAKRRVTCLRFRKGLCVASKRKLKVRAQLVGVAAVASLCVGGPARAVAPNLLFRLSADQGFTADKAGGDPVPNFVDKVRIVPTGAIGGAIQWDDDGVVTWNAPGNIYAQRGALS